MEEQTSLVRRLSSLEWTGGSTGLIRYCKDQNSLRKILSEGLYQAISLYTKETPEQNVRIMMEDILADYSYEPVGVILRAIDSIRKGDVKVFGLVTPNVVREALNKQLENQAIDRERQHERNKGFAEQEVTTRTSGRISDLIPISDKPKKKDSPPGS